MLMCFPPLPCVREGSENLTWFPAELDTAHAAAPGIRESPCRAWRSKSAACARRAFLLLAEDVCTMVQDCHEKVIKSIENRTSLPPARASSGRVTRPRTPDGSQNQNPASRRKTRRGCFLLDCGLERQGIAASLAAIALGTLGHWSCGGSYRRNAISSIPPGSHRC